MTTIADQSAAVNMESHPVRLSPVTGDVIIEIMLAVRVPEGLAVHARVRSHGRWLGAELRQVYRFDLANPALEERRILKALILASKITVDEHGGFSASALRYAVLRVEGDGAGGWSTPRALTCKERDALPAFKPANQIDLELRSTLATTAKGEIRSCGLNVAKVLDGASIFTGRLRFDLRNECVCFVDNPRLRGDDLDVAIANQIAADWSIYLSTAVVSEQLRAVARRDTYDPVAEYLTGLSWDCTPRIDRWLIDYCYAADTEYVSLVGAKWLIAAVARALAPGCKVDNMLIMYGEQDLKKSSAFAALGGEYHEDNKLDIGTKEAKQALQRAWIVEHAELAALRKADIESLKGFITQQSDNYRTQYERHVRPHPRHCIFAGTTNKREVLTDEDNRRFWIVDIPEVIDIEALKRDRDQIWAEAVARYRTGEQWWLTREQARIAREIANDHMVENPWADTIRAYVARTPSAHPEGYRLTELAMRCCGVRSENLNARVNEVAKAARLAGLVSRQATHDPDRPRLWVRADEHVPDRARRT